jgi:hypothetical protein
LGLLTTAAQHEKITCIDLHNLDLSISSIACRSIIFNFLFRSLSMNQNAGVSQCTHLVILCCHAVYHGTRGSDPRDEKNWALKSFQRGTSTKSGEHETFLQHAFTAVQLKNEQTLIAFSGGPTDASYPGLSEAQSYVNALRDWGNKIGWEVENNVLEDILLEDAATDSYQNVLFSILSFRRRTGYYPRDLTIITHAFKNDRFLYLHAKALRWPADHVRALGINPPFTSMWRILLYCNTNSLFTCYMALNPGLGSPLL